ncbi:hypothetical protein BDV96DRAFT_646145 [Lophiotrema nucula]|uniref:Uncharacterized protein n=1 Tax=Lophiotrema nucula TaxID=690887 RepID=A0A6A5ZBA4_9PLEO|nr:hypothetical protein BDV96DRAFT_646145 [Lophiotrema nucula]
MLVGDFLQRAFRVYNNRLAFSSTIDRPPARIGRFQELRARYESPTKSECELPLVRQRPSRMVGRKDKQAAQQAIAVNPEDSGVGKFRRKLSHGLSFISNPLSQRKNTPGRQNSGSSVTTVVTTTSDVTPSRNTSGTRLSPIRDSSFFDQAPGSPATPTSSPGHHQTRENDDPEVTPKALPRSRTMSFIPRPSRSFSNASVEVDRTTPKPRSPPAFHLAPTGHARPTKIPSPPRSGGRPSSPRQYAHYQTPTEAKHIGAGMAFALAQTKGRDQSPSKNSVRSQTTPNLVKGSNTPQPGFMMPRKPGVPLKSARSQEMSLKENIPTGKRDSSYRRMSKIQEQTSAVLAQQKLLSINNNTASRRSLGPGALAQSKQTTATPLAAKRLSSNLSANTPLKVKQPHPNKQNIAPASTSLRNSNGATIVQPRLMGPVDPPTPPAFGTPSARPALPRASTDRDLRRRTFGAASVISGGRLSSRSMIGANKEVRLPRSSTFHSIPRPREAPPPVPPIPEEYSSPLAARNPTPGSRIPTPSVGLVGRSELPAKVSRLPVAKSEPCLLKNLQPATIKQEVFLSSFDTNIGDNASQNPSLSPDSDDAARWDRQLRALKLHLDLAMHQASGVSARRWSTNTIHYEGADLDEISQITDYMPPLWWAGRFQSRLDRWRTDAMQAELGARYKPDGLLGQCKLNEDKTAACYIFLQLRDLCGSGKAADSLWEFEHKYRQEHSLLEAMTSVGPAPTRSDLEVTTPKQSSFGKAVRKLTPRKASLVNLLKGKGWNKVDEPPKLPKAPPFGF